MQHQLHKKIRPFFKSRRKTSHLFSKLYLKKDHTALARLLRRYSSRACVKELEICRAISASASVSMLHCACKKTFDTKLIKTIIKAITRSVQVSLKLGEFNNNCCNKTSERNGVTYLTIQRVVLLKRHYINVQYDRKSQIAI